MAKSHFEQKMEQLDNNYNRYFQTTLEQLQKEYQEAFKSIQVEILKWYKAMDEVKHINPNYKFSELKHLEELTKQIDLILKELAYIEAEQLGNSLNELYVSDYMDLGKLNERYGIIANKPMPELNQLKSIEILEAYMNMPTLAGDAAEIAKQMDLGYWYSPIQGKWFNTRIEERAKKLGYSIENKLKQSIIRGEGYNKIAGEVMRDLDISFNSAKTLVATELRAAEVSANLHQAKKNGYTHMERRSMRDSHVCQICREMDGALYPIDEVNSGDFMLHPNDRCLLVEVVVDDKGDKVKSQYYNEAQAYVRNKAAENAERAKRIRAEYFLNNKQ